MNQRDGDAAEPENSFKKAPKDKDDSLLPLPLLKPTYEKLPLASQPLSVNHANPPFAQFLLAEGLSSMETLLTNIQVALESSRSQSKQSQLERKELKLQLERERDARHTLQRQLSSELQSTVWIQRRLKKEKKAKRKLQEEFNSEILQEKNIYTTLPLTLTTTVDHTRRTEQDNAAIHTARLTKDFFQQNSVALMVRPACSPDLHPIENIWGWMAREVYRNGRQFQTVDALREAIFTTRSNVPSSLLGTAASSMVKREFEVINKNGGAAHY
ncbi:hypothetical protein PFLUV_G00185520 [Perca fluviatilis]|uniref:Tc1-like transposase DDE domain-containing protein n=1 Tax=Perca fluviatilis TaxID=8168 RepID=A0A6A5E5V9_PERFL|nr:hypothetical protein PFLUV_G00185520 [Perca fluviatilis]